MVGARLPERRLVPPAAASGEPRRQPQAPQAASAAQPGWRAGDRRAAPRPAPAAGRRSPRRSSEALDQALVDAARPQRHLLAPGHPQRDAGRAAPKRSAIAAIGERRELPERARHQGARACLEDPQSECAPPPRLRVRGGAVAGQPLAEEAHRQRREEGARHGIGHDHGGPSRPRPARGRVGAEPGPARAPSLTAARSHLVPSAALPRCFPVEPAQPGRLEERLARAAPARPPRRSPSKRRQGVPPRPPPRSSGSGGTRVSSGQRASASPRRIPARTPNASAGPGCLPDHLRAAGLRRQRHRLEEQLPAARPTIASRVNRGISAHAMTGFGSVSTYEHMFVHRAAEIKARLSRSASRSSRTSTIASTSSGSVVRQFKIAGRNATGPRRGWSPCRPARRPRGPRPAAG